MTMDISTVTDFFKNVQNSQILLLFASGGILFTLINNAKSIFGRIADFVLELISFSVHSVVIADYDIPPLIYKMNKVFAKTRVLWERDVEIQPSSSGYEEKKMTESAYGRSIRLVFGKLVVLDRSYTMQSTKMAVKIRMRVFFANKKRFLDRIMGEIEKCSLHEDDKTVTIKMGKGITTVKPWRSVDSVYSNDNVVQKIRDDIRCFLGNRQVYTDSSSPWKFVALLSGVPGCGKTSAIHAIASEFGMDVRFLSLADEDFYDVARILSNTEDEKRRIIVIEDIDAINTCMTDSRTKGGVTDADSQRLKRAADDTLKELGMYDDDEDNDDDVVVSVSKSELSLSSLLNLLDGIITPSGTIILLTTNHPERLDDAILRDGRVDSHYVFTDFSRETANRMIRDYLGFEIDGIRDGISPSSLQRSILKVKTGAMGKDEFVHKFSVE